MLFVVADLDNDLRRRINAALWSELSPRHVPDTIAAVPAIPRTLTGEEARGAGQADPARRAGRAVASRGALAEPDAIAAFVRFHEERTVTAGAVHGARRERRP